MVRRQIVVSGMGLVTPLGSDRLSSWEALLAGRSGVRNGTMSVPLPRSEVLRPVQLACTAACEALQDADLALPAANGERWGCVVSCSKPILIERAQGPESAGESSLDLRGGWESMDGELAAPDIVPRAVGRRFGVCGPVTNVASACATGLHSVMVGAEWIREGRCDFVLAGAAESSLHPLYLSGFEQLGVLSKSGTMRPFDEERDGFVVGEGAAVFVLESTDAASRRNAVVYGELKGWDFSCDASHATRFNSNGRRIASSLSHALRRASVGPKDVDYVNAHGTATIANDALEAQALQSIFQNHPSLKVSSTKGSTGHLLGAAGAVELAFCLLALRNQRVPPTLNLCRPLTRALDFVPETFQAARVQTAATLSFGFGGTLASLVVESTDKKVRAKESSALP